MPRTAALGLVLLFALPACSDDRTAIAVMTSDTACLLDAISVKPGKQEFSVTNDGSSPVDVSLMRSPEDTLLAVEHNIGPRGTARLVAKLDGGQYNVACVRAGGADVKRAHLFVSGPDGAPGIGMPDADRVVDVYARDFRFDNLAQLDSFEGQVYGGEMIIFRLSNDGPSEHTFAVNAPDGRRLAVVPRTELGARQQVTFSPPTGGTYTYLCLLGDHAAKGMRGTFKVVVSEAEASPAAT